MIHTRIYSPTKKRRETAIEDALGRQLDGPPTPHYVLGRLDALFDPENGDNPLHAAGVSEEDEASSDFGSYLDVYDMAMIDSFEPDISLDDEGNYADTRVVTEVTEEQLSLAALACVRLNYIIVNEDV